MKNKSYYTIKKISISLVIAGLGLLWIYFSRVPEELNDQQALRVPQVGFKAPFFSLPTLDGYELDLDDLSTSPMVINFWASWCPPCKAEMPAFQLASEEYSETDLIITAINATNQDSVDNARSFLEREEINLLVLLDYGGLASKAYNIHSLPTTYFINRNGMISKILIGGPIPLPLLRIEIDKILQD